MNRRVPLWLMGLTNASYGLYAGIQVFALPQLLSARHVPEATIAAMSAVELSPGFWAFLLSPALDVRFSRRWYACALAIIAAVLLLLAMLNLDHIYFVEAAITLGFLSSYLYQSAVGGWLSSITTHDEEASLSIWMTIGNAGGGALMAILCGEIVRVFSVSVAAVLLALIVLLPTVVFPFMPAPGPDRRLASESFPQFFGELVALVKRREVLIAVILFITPAGSFALTNFLAGLGADYHASPRSVSLIAGLGAGLAGIAGSFLFKPLSGLMKLRPLYLAIGFGGSLITVSLLTLAHTPTSFGIALVVENLLQSLAITASTAIMFDTIGRNNPLASTTFCFLGSMYGLPLSYMLYVDGIGYAHRGVSGSYATDGLCGVLSSGLLGLLLVWLSRRARNSSKPPQIAAHGA
jgi:PAT family beta-lactamase induction signal transducer AmpG